RGGGASRQPGGSRRRRSGRCTRRLARMDDDVTQRSGLHHGIEPRAAGRYGQVLHHPRAGYALRTPSGGLATLDVDRPADRAGFFYRLPRGTAACRVSCSAMEAEFVQWLTRRAAPRADLVCGIGDDAAVYAVRQADGVHAADQVVTTDLLCDGVHFRLAETPPRTIG